jgi:hypothetical protein
MFLFIIDQWNGSVIQRLPIQQYLADMLSHMFRVVHLDKVQGFPELITDLKSIQAAEPFLINKC